VIDGPFTVEAPSAGDLTVEYETPTWGLAAAEAGHTGFEVRRSRPEAAGTVHATADLAIESKDASDRIDLPRGSARSVAVRLPALDAGALYAGEVRVLDDGGKVRLAIPLRIDRRTDPQDDVPAAEARLVDALRRAAEGVAGRPFPAPEAVRRALEATRRARGLRAEDRDLEILELRLLASQADDAKVRGAAMPRLEALLSRLDRTDAGDRVRLGRVHLLRAAFGRAAGTKTDADLAEARFLLPADDPELLAERFRRGSASHGDRRDALAAAKALRERDPSDFEASRAVVRTYLALGWGVPAASVLRTWPEAFPTRGAEFRAACDEARSAGGDPAPRTLAMLEAGAP
jgi:hypothetical protein